MKTSAQPPVAPTAPVVEPAVPCWRLQIAAAPDPLLLPRVLQKLAVPEIALHTVHYAAATPAGGSRIDLTFAARPERARLATVRLQKLIGLHEAVLGPIGGLPPAVEWSNLDG